MCVPRVEGSPQVAGQPSALMPSAAPIPAPAQPATQETRDLVVGRQAPNTSAGEPDWRRRVEELEADRTRRVEQDAAREAMAEDKAREPGFFRKVLEAAETFLRSLPLIGQLLNLFSAVYRIVLIMFTDTKLDDEQKIRLAADLAGVFYAPAGALGSAGANYWFGDGGKSEILGGVNQLWDYRTVLEYDERKKRYVERKQAVEVRSGTRDTVDGALDTLKGIYETVKRVVGLGGDDAPTRGIDTRPLRPAELPVG